MRILQPFLAALAVCVALTAVSARANEVALVIGNSTDGRNGERASVGAVMDATEPMSAAGIAVISGSRADGTAMRRLMAQLEQMAPSADGLAVVLTGRFVASDTDTYFLPEDGDAGSLSQIARDAVPLSSVLAVLSHRPGRALLVLSPGGDTARLGPFLRRGIGPLDLPQGVTLVRGEPSQVARWMRGTLARRGAPLVRDAETLSDMSVGGYRPSGLTFLASDAALSDAGEAAALRRQLDAARSEADTARRSVEAVRAQMQNAEAALWAAAQAEDTVAGYRRYLTVFPEGRRAAEADRILRQIQDDPFRAERRVEQALSLTRDQRERIQRDLNALGFDTRGIDGIFGSGTRAAIRNWQGARSLGATGFLTAPQVSRLSQEARETRNRRDAERDREDRVFWERSGARGTEAGFRRYLERFPEGRFADEARRGLAAFDNDTSAGRPDERLEWRRATTQNTVDGYRRFLDLFPDSIYGDNARARLRGLEGPSPGATGNAAAEAAENALRLPGTTRRIIEVRLRSMGMDPGEVDGNFDAFTRRALREYQERVGLPVTGYVSEALVVRLLADSVRDILR